MPKVAYTDGACRVSNPGQCSCAWVLYSGNEEVAWGGAYLGPELHTNNYAEYMGLALLLEYLYTNNIRNVLIHSDSALVVNQTLGKWEINQPELCGYAARCYGLLTQGCHVLKHVKGHVGNKGNERADQLCNQVLDEHMEEFSAAQTVVKN